MFKRIFLIVLDSFGIGELPDSHLYGDEGSNTLMAVNSTGLLNVPTLKSLGLFNIDGVNLPKEESPLGSFGRFAEKSNGKDTTTGHWEISGVIPKFSFPTFSNGFPDEILDKIIKKWGVDGILCNSSYSGTEVIKDYGLEHIKTKKPIIYTSQDSVFQIACHEDVFSRAELYKLCEIARELLVDEYNVGRVIARPFLGSSPVGEGAFYRTDGRKDFSVEPPEDTMLDILSSADLDVISIGKIYDVFCGRGITKKIKAKTNWASCEGLNQALQEDFTGLCFCNFVDFDTLYGHRNDAVGYAKSLNEFDVFLKEFLTKLKEDDLVLITADHGCDPITPSTDHSREYIPLLAYGSKVKTTNLFTRDSFADIGATICENFNVKLKNGSSFLNKIIK